MKNNLENNKLIAEFMNTTYEQKKNTHGVVLYEVSWDWLMEVVEKIESIGGQQVFINGCSCNILGEKHETIKGYGTKLEATYKAVVQFIKWYNSVKENTTD